MEPFRGHPRPALWPRGGTRREESGGNCGQILLGLLRDCLLIWEDLKSTVNSIEKSTIERGLNREESRWRGNRTGRPLSLLQIH